MIVKIEPYQASINAIEERLQDMGKEFSAHDVLKKAINEVAGVGKENIYKAVKDTYTLKGFKKANIKKKNSTSRNPGATITVTGEVLGVRANYQNRKNSKHKGASVKVLRSGSLKEITLQHGNGSYKGFVAVMKSGHEGTFQRVSGKYMKNKKNREAIKEILSLSIAKAAEIVFERENMYSELQEEISYRMLKHMHAVIGV